MRKVNIHEAKTYLSSLLSEIEEKGEHILVCRYNVPVAELSPIKQRRRSILHPELSSIDFIHPPEEATEAEWEDV